MQKPPQPECLIDMDPEAWKRFIDQLHCRLLRITRELNCAVDLGDLCAALDLLVAEDRVTSPARTPFVITA